MAFSITQEDRLGTSNDKFEHIHTPNRHTMAAIWPV